MPPLPRSLKSTIVLTTIFAATSASAFAHPGHLQARHPGLTGATSQFAVPFPGGANMGGFSSPNVEFVKNIPEHVDSAGARKLGDFFYITTSQDLTIYDVSKSADPMKVGSLRLPDSGMPVFAEEDPDTNGRVLLASNRGRLSVIDVTNKRAPKVLSTLSGADQHTITCVLDCKWAYGSEGLIIDLRDPAKPKLSPNKWKTADIESFHDVTEVSPGIILTSSQPLKLLDARKDPERPVELASTPKEPGRFVHANLWPRGGTDDFLLVGGEAMGPNCSADVSSTFSTWDARQFRETGVTKQLDEFRLGPGAATQGRAPDSSYCVHWFTEHPYYENGGLVAISWYEHGTHFLKIGKDGKITEVGFFLGGGGQASAAYWIDERTVYVSDYLRGFDVLRFTGDIGTPPSTPATPGGNPTGPSPQTNGQSPSQNQGSQSGAQATLGSVSSPSCTKPAGFGTTTVKRQGSGLNLAFSKTSPAPVTVDVFQQTIGRRVINERLVARFTNRSDDVRWNGKANRVGRAVTDGYYLVRYRTRTGDGTDTRRIALRREGGRWKGRPAFYRRADCDLVKSFKLERPVFGGSSNRALGINYKVERDAQVTVTVLRGTKVVKEFVAQVAAAGKTYRLSLAAAGRSAGDYRVRIEARRGSERVTSTLVSRRL